MRAKSSRKLKETKKSRNWRSNDLDDFIVPSDEEEDVESENEDGKVECGYMMQCVEEENAELKAVINVVEETPRRVIVDDATGLIETDWEVEGRTEYGEYGAEGRRLRPREERGIWSEVSDDLWEVRAVNAWFDDDWMENGQQQYWLAHLQRVLDWGGEKGVGGVHFPTFQERVSES